jgi:hypothetical protein
MSGTGVFDNRSTRLVFNDYLPSVISPWVAVERDAPEMARSSESQVSQMIRIQGIGWQLESYHSKPSDPVWLTAAASGNLSVANGASVAPKMVEEDSFVKPSLSGVSYDSSVQASGAPKIQAKYAAVDDRSTNTLSTDQSSYPGPNTSEDATNLDRVYKFTSTNPDDDLQFRLHAPGSSIVPSVTLATFYFGGPAGSDKAASSDSTKFGQGKYALKVRGDGKCCLYEKLADNSWLLRTTFPWFDPSEPIRSTDAVFNVYRRVWVDTNGDYQGDRLAFGVKAVIDAATGTETGFGGVAASAAFLASYNAPVKTFEYVPPRLTQKATTLESSHSPVRIDLARDVRASFSVAKHVYKDSGYILDDWMDLGVAIGTSENIYVYIYGVKPSGSDWSLAVYDQNGTALSSAGAIATATVPYGVVSVQGFTPTARMSKVRVKVSATASSDKFKTPTVTNYAVYKAPVYTTDNPLSLAYCPTYGSNLPRSTVESVMIHNPDQNPQTDTATITVSDLYGDLSFLGNRNMVPILVQTRYDTTSTNWANLFRGYVLQATGENMRNGIVRWTLQCSGEWARMQETTLPMRKSWAARTSGGAVYNVTDVIRYYAQLIYPASMVDVPDISVPLLGDDPSALTPEPGSKVFDNAKGLCDDYLGSYLDFDPSAGSKGMLRMFTQKKPPYNNLAVFEIKHPTTLAGDGVPRLPQFCAAYGTTTSSGQTIQYLPIIAGSYRSWLEKAEGNLVRVVGGAHNEDASKAGTVGMGIISQFAIKTDSFNFLGLASSASHYPDGSSPEFYGRVVPITVVDFKCGSQDAVNWKCRRIFDKACYTQFYLRFEAPLILVTDINDSLQTSPRPLRYYDAVQVRQPDASLAQFLVVSCTPSYKKDHVQMAEYVLVTQSNINTIGIVNKESRGYRAFKKALSRAKGSQEEFNSYKSSQQASADHLKSQMMGLPTFTALPIQDLDPTSSTFGQFINMSSYDAVPSRH